MVKQLPEAISIRQTSQILGVHYMTVWCWIRDGYIQASRVGPRCIRIPISEIARMRKHRVNLKANAERMTYPQV